MNVTTNTLRYSPHPVETYVREVDGLVVGPGMNPLLVKDLAAWNLYWLSYPELESHTALGTGGFDLYPDLDPLAKIAAKSSRQFIGSTRLSDLLLHLPPDLFVAELHRRPHRELALAKFFQPELWMSVMEFRAALHKSVPSHGAPEGVLLH